jgi:hypothetical protein
MGADVRAQCERRVEELGQEVGVSKQRLAESGDLTEWSQATAGPLGTTSSPSPGSPAQLLPWVKAWYGEAEVEPMPASREQIQQSPDAVIMSPSGPVLLQQVLHREGSQSNALTTELRRRRLEYTATSVPPEVFSESSPSQVIPHLPGSPGRHPVEHMVENAGALHGLSVSGNGTAVPSSGPKLRPFDSVVPPVPSLGRSESSGGWQRVEVVLRKTAQGQIFGFTNVPEVALSGQRFLRITKVSPSGLLAAWNSLYPRRSVGIGDRIISVNSISEDLAQMRDLLCGVQAVT